MDYHLLNKLNVLHIQGDTMIESQCSISIGVCLSTKDNNKKKCNYYDIFLVFRIYSFHKI